MKTTAALLLLDSVVADGIGAHEAAVAALAARAARRGLAPVLVAAATDLGGPPVARERALGRLVGQLLHEAVPAPVERRAADLRAA